MCDFEASTRPINIVLRKDNTTCYLLDNNISRNLKGWVPVENTSSQRETQRSVPHAIARVIIKNLFERIFDGGAHRVRFRDTWVWNESAVAAAIDPLLLLLLSIRNSEFRTRKL